MLERCKEFMEGQDKKLRDERRLVAQKTEFKQVPGEVIRLRIELEKAQRD